jgi:hypothetical protein
MSPITGRGHPNAVIRVIVMRPTRAGAKAPGRVLVPCSLGMGKWLPRSRHCHISNEGVGDPHLATRVQIPATALLLNLRLPAGPTTTDQISHQT